jgi:hypothetical protein
MSDMEMLEPLDHEQREAVLRDHEARRGVLVREGYDYTLEEYLMQAGTEKGRQFHVEIRRWADALLTICRN